MLSRNLEQTLHRALALANERRHEYATLEHLLLALTDDTTPRPCCAPAASTSTSCKRDLTEFLDKDLAGLVTDRGGDPKPTAGFQRVVQRAAIHVQSSGRDEVTGANVLVALFSERESHAVYFLQQQDMTPARRGELHQPRHRQGAGPRRAAPGAGRRQPPERSEEPEKRGEAARRPQPGRAVQLLRQPQQEGAGRARSTR